MSTLNIQVDKLSLKFRVNLHWAGSDILKIKFINLTDRGGFVIGDRAYIRSRIIYN